MKSKSLLLFVMVLICTSACAPVEARPLVKTLNKIMEYRQKHPVVSLVFFAVPELVLFPVTFPLEIYRQCSNEDDRLKGISNDINDLFSEYRKSQKLNAAGQQ